MKAVVQRVLSASVSIEGQVISEIGPGLLTLLGVEKGDTEADMKKLLEKLVGLRVFEDDQGKMNLSLSECGGQHLLVSQFTLLADCKKGRRPNFLQAEEPAKAEDMYKKALEFSESLVETKGGQFAGDMKVSLINDGPVTVLLECRDGQLL